VQFATPEHLLAEPADDFVESFLGYDRGFRRLSFFEAKALSLREPKTVIRGAGTGATNAGVDNGLRARNALHRW
jgi:osmoprotectant transport system ATP-binding protein